MQDTGTHGNKWEQQYEWFRRLRMATSTSNSCIFSVNANVNFSLIFYATLKCLEYVANGFNPYLANVLILYSLKTPEDQRFFW